MAKLLSASMFEKPKELEKDGMIETVTGKGSFVAEQNTQLIKEEKLKNIEERKE